MKKRIRFSLPKAKLGHRVLRITRRNPDTGRYGLALHRVSPKKIGMAVAWSSFHPDDLTPLQEWIETYKPVRIISKWADEPELQAALQKANITVTKE
jgi:hypothetical protein